MQFLYLFTGGALVLAGMYLNCKLAGTSGQPGAPGPMGPPGPAGPAGPSETDEDV